MEEKKEENELHVRMIEIKLTQHETVGDLSRYVRGRGLVKRNELVK